MADCPDCGREMLTATTCSIKKFAFPDGSMVSRIPFGSERPPWRMERCGDCGVKRGGYHHPGCDIEQCPVCLQQFISCGCSDGETEGVHADEGTDWVDIPAAIEIISRLIHKDPEIDHIFIDPVAACGHVGTGHVREMVRGGELPLDEWFTLGGWMGADMAAVLFACRSRDFETLSEEDLDVGLRMAAYTKTHTAPPWELVYITKRGNFKASDLLAFPGHPQFEPCNYIGWEESSNRLGF